MERVLITGANSGFGYLTSLKFARNSYCVFAGVRDFESEGAKNLLDIAKKENLKIELIKLDITNQEDIDNAVKKIEEGGLDVLVNNAGFGMIGPVELFTVEEIKKQFETNFFGTFRMIKAFIPMMRKRGRGKIINLSSIAGVVSSPLYGIYSSSKFALEGMCEALRTEVNQFNIKVVLIEPGAFSTNFGKNLDRDIKEKVFGSVYEKWFSKYLKSKSVWSSEGDSFLNVFRNPEMVANKIYKVANKSNPKLRYNVGIDSSLIALGRKIMPNSMWNWLVAKIMG